MASSPSLTMLGCRKMVVVPESVVVKPTWCSAPVLALMVSSKVRLEKAQPSGRVSTVPLVVGLSAES